MIIIIIIRNSNSNNAYHLARSPNFKRVWLSRRDARPARFGPRHCLTTDALFCPARRRPPLPRSRRYRNVIQTKKTHKGQLENAPRGISSERTWPPPTRTWRMEMACPGPSPSARPGARFRRDKGAPSARSRVRSMSLPLHRETSRRHLGGKADVAAILSPGRAGPDPPAWRSGAVGWSPLAVDGRSRRRGKKRGKQTDKKRVASVSFFREASRELPGSVRSIRRHAVKTNTKKCNNT